MNLVRASLSLLIACLVVISLLGIAWWSEPPQPLAGYALAGKVTLGVLALAGLAGIWQLWTPPARRGSPR